MCIKFILPSKKLKNKLKCLSPYKSPGVDNLHPQTIKRPFRFLIITAFSVINKAF